MEDQGRRTVSSDLPGHLIRRLHQRSTQVFMVRVVEAGFDLTPVQFAALDALRLSPGIDQAGLADLIAKDRATIGAVVERLRKKGLVAREISARDRRSRELKLTAEGDRVLTALLPVVISLQREVLAGLDEGEYDRFVELARRASAA